MKEKSSHPWLFSGIRTSSQTSSKRALFIKRLGLPKPAARGRVIDKTHAQVAKSGRPHNVGRCDGAVSKRLAAGYKMSVISLFALTSD
jgi:hypothetical protein